MKLRDLKELFKDSPIECSLFLFLCLILVISAVLGGIRVYHVISGNKQIIDTNFDFNRAIIELPNGEVVDGEIDTWKDYDDGDQLQIIMEDGRVYLTSTYHCTLVKDN